MDACVLLPRWRAVVDGGQVEVELAAVDIDPNDADFELVAQAVAAARATADQGVGFGLEVVVVVGQAGDVDEALDGQFGELAEEAEVFDADDDGVEGFTDAGFEVSEELDLDQLAFGGIGPAFGAGAVLAQDEQFVGVGLGLLAGQEGDELAVDLEVGVAADGGREVAVVVGGQGEVAFVVGRVGGLLQAAQVGRSEWRSARAYRPRLRRTRWRAKRD